MILTAKQTPSSIFSILENSFIKRPPAPTHKKEREEFLGFFSVFFGSGHWATQEGLIWSIGKSVFPNFSCCSQKGRLFQAMMIGDDELTFLGKCHLSFSLCCTRKESFESNQCHMRDYCSESHWGTVFLENNTDFHFPSPSRKMGIWIDPLPWKWVMILGFSPLFFFYVFRIHFLFFNCKIFSRPAGSVDGQTKLPGTKMCPTPPFLMPKRAFK